MFFNLARNARAFGHLYFLSSGAIYDRTHCHPRTSEDEFDAHVPADDYGFSKYLCAKAVDALEGVTELRLFGVFGPHEDWRVRFLSNACCRAVWDMPIVIRQNVRFDYLDVDDLGGILERFLAAPSLHCHYPPRHRHYNVCAGRTFDLETLAAKVVAVSGKPSQIHVSRPGLGAEYSGDNSRLLAEFPDLGFRDMDDSIARLYRWYEARKTEIDPALLRFDE
jgi:UDP-glucose 4-epimerase